MGILVAKLVAKVGVCGEGRHRRANQGDWPASACESGRLEFLGSWSQGPNQGAGNGVMGVSAVALTLSR